MSISAKAAAREICELSDWQVTNLRLQKILYLAHMVFLYEHNGEPLINGYFEAWDYGPVVPVLFNEAKGYGSKPIRMGFYTIHDISGTPEQEAIERSCAYLFSKSNSDLVRVTHRTGGAWDKNYVSGQTGNMIPNRDILDEYRELKILTSCVKSI